MKIACTGSGLPEGKVKYQDPIVLALTEKFRPAKVSPYFFEFLPGAYEPADAIVIAADRILDLLILDIEKVENRMARCDGDEEREAMSRALAHLESGRPLCDMPANGDRTVLRNLGPFSLKPTLVIETPVPDIGAICGAVMEKAGMMFFYTAGKQEVHAWFTPKGSNAVTCAGKIHTDLARGFIKAELVDFNDLMTVHSMEEARKKGLTRLVDRDCIVPEQTVLEIRFNV